MAKSNIKQETINKLIGLADDIDFFYGYDMPKGEWEKLAKLIGNLNNIDPALDLEEDEDIVIDTTSFTQPIFPKNILDSWPEPWPTIWKEWQNLPRVLCEELLIPTILAVHAQMLKGDFLTPYDRKLGLYFLTIAPSASHKDGNSRDVIYTIINRLNKLKRFNNSLSNCLEYPSNITNDTSFLESFKREGLNKGNLFWLNTEATRLFQKLSGKQNESVSALSDKIIELVDGRAITSKGNKSGKSVKEPNGQILFYTQPETIHEYMTRDLIDSGLLGRTIITLYEKPKSTDSMFVEPNSTVDMDPVLADFYHGLRYEKQPTRVLFSDHNQLEKMEQFYEQHIKPLDVDNASYKMISRLGNTAEQLFALMVGVCHKWDDMHGVERREIPVDGMLPLLEYWAKVKKYVIRKYIENEECPRKLLVKTAIERLALSRNLEDKDIEIYKRYSMLRRTRVVNIIVSNNNNEIFELGEWGTIRETVNNYMDKLIKESYILQESRLFGNIDYIKLNPDNISKR